jgi:HNH endonuclease
MKMDEAKAAKFWSQVVIEDATACWRWTRAKKSYGYGSVAIGGRAGFGAHRVAYIDIFGEPPAGLVLDHLCRNKACVNPWHLEPVTDEENILRGDSPPAQNARKTECSMRGHQLTGDNVIWSREGWRKCRTCQNIAHAAHKAKKRARSASDETSLGRPSRGSDAPHGRRAG